MVDIFWSTPWHILGANVAFELTPSWLEVGQNHTSFVRGTFNPWVGTTLGWGLGGGWNFSYTAAGYLPIETDVSGNFYTFEQRFGVSYLANGWNLTGRFVFGLTGDDENTGKKDAPDYLNFDFTATKKFGKWEAGLVGFASTDLDKPFIGYAEQSQVALGGLVGYDFGGVTLRAKLTRTITESNYGGYDTRLWTDVIIPLWTPSKVDSFKD